MTVISNVGMIDQYTATLPRQMQWPLLDVAVFLLEHNVDIIRLQGDTDLYQCLK